MAKKVLAVEMMTRDSLSDYIFTQQSSGIKIISISNPRYVHNNINIQLFRLSSQKAGNHESISSWNEDKGETVDM